MQTGTEVPCTSFALSTGPPYPHRRGVRPTSLRVSDLSGTPLLFNSESLTPLLTALAALLV